MAQPPYGQPPQYSPAEGPGGPYGQYPPSGPQQRSNGFAVAGIVLAILLWPLGLVFAIIGLVKSRSRAGAGKVLSIVSIVVAVVVGAASTSLIAVVGNSPAADPGCISAENAFQSILNKLSSDESAMSAGTNNPALEKAAIGKFTADAQTLVTKLNAAEAEATHQSVRNAIGKASGDLSTMLTALRAVENGNVSQLGTLETKANAMAGDGTAIDNICSSL